MQALTDEYDKLSAVNDALSEENRGDCACACACVRVNGWVEGWVARACLWKTGTIHLTKLDIRYFWSYLSVYGSAALANEKLSLRAQLASLIEEQQEAQRVSKEAAAELARAAAEKAVAEEAAGGHTPSALEAAVAAALETEIGPLQQQLVAAEARAGELEGVLERERMEAGGALADSRRELDACHVSPLRRFLLSTRTQVGHLDCDRPNWKATERSCTVRWAPTPTRWLAAMHVYKS
jgi:hypothetical protein